MAPTVRLGKILGIEIAANWSLLFVFAYLAWLLATQALPSAVPDQPASAYWVASVLGGVAFYACLLAHEMSHALVARARGVRVSTITLWLFGGVANLTDEPKTARDEALIAGVGPLTSLAVAALAVGLTVAATPWPLAQAVFGWLAVVNGVLAVFNLVPAFPLDGGRLLNAFLWWRRGSRQQAVHQAVRIGRVFAYLIIAAGALLLFTVDVVNGVWLAFLGWFLLSAGQSEEAGTVIKASLRSVPVSAAMTSPVVTIPDWLTIQQFLENVAPAHHFATYPVHDPAGQLTGVVRLNDLIRAGGAARAGTRLNAVARPLSEVPVTRPDEDLSALLQRVGAALENRALVFDDGQLVGIVSPVDIARLLTARQSAPRS
jgi:Zn-dependent protease/predicted transcriptional regulator